MQTSKCKLVSVDPDVELLVFEVWDSDETTLNSNMIGYFGARVCNIREGVRFCPLHGKGGAAMWNFANGETESPGLLVKVKKEWKSGKSECTPSFMLIWNLFCLLLACMR